MTSKLEAQLHEIEAMLPEPCTPFRDREAPLPEWALRVCKNPDGSLDIDRFGATMASWRRAYDLANVEIARGDLRKTRDEWPIDLLLFVDTRIAARFGVSLREMQAAQTNAPRSP